MSYFISRQIGRFNPTQSRLVNVTFTRQTDRISRKGLTYYVSSQKVNVELSWRYDYESEFDSPMMLASKTEAEKIVGLAVEQFERDHVAGFYRSCTMVRVGDRLTIVLVDLGSGETLAPVTFTISRKAG